MPPRWSPGSRRTQTTAPEDRCSANDSLSHVGELGEYALQRWLATSKMKSASASNGIDCRSVAASAPSAIVWVTPPAGGTARSGEACAPVALARVLESTATPHTSNSRSTRGAQTREELTLPCLLPRQTAHPPGCATAPPDFRQWS